MWNWLTKTEDEYDIANWRVPEFIVRELLFVVAVFLRDFWETLVVVVLVSAIVSVIAGGIAGWVTSR